MTESSRERIQETVYGPPRFTTSEGAGGSISAPTETDERGVLKELTAHQIEKLTRPQVLEYQRKRSEQIEAKRAEEAEADDFSRYQETFVEAGGRAKDAKAAWEAQKRLDATEAAQQARSAALDASRRRVRHGL
jgi:hypothetical protein